MARFQGWRRRHSKKPIEPLLLRSPDGRFGISIPASVLERLLLLCGEALPKETGGILIGRYNDSLDVALVSRATPAPPDSVSGPTWFSRGTRGLSSLLKGLWKERQYYLGEWHFHPQADPTPSPTDEGQLCDISADRNYHCATPLLLIMGGNPKEIWAARAFAFPRAESRVELL
jgi:integrative and conjugative element protein (TIGR02256 family)